VSVRRATGLVAALAAVAFAVWASLSFPHLNDVETGRTPEYRDLQPRQYVPSPADVTQAAKAVAERLGWTYVGSGTGPGGSEIKVIARTKVFRFPSDVTIKIKRDKAGTSLSVRSTSRYGRWDFGQNARFIRAFLTEMDIELE
jgi:uncharacterized protein (DUF1499 family)